MKTIEEGALAFDFPDNVSVLKYDDTDIYRNHVQKVSPSRRGVDILCLTTEKTLWLIEVKDYRLDAMEQDRSTLPDVIVDKVLDTLSGLWCAESMICRERIIAAEMRRAEGLRVVAHVEGRGRLKDDSKRLRKSQTDWAFAADLKVKLRRKFVKLGLSSAVASVQIPEKSCPWTVRNLSLSEVQD